MTAPISIAGFLQPHVPASPDADGILEALLDYCETAGIDPYDAQVEAFDAISKDRHVVLNTPTGSGKSLVALAAHFTGACRGTRSIYTAPIKALVNEKFFDLCRAFGPENVGLMTGDATVNRDAPIICCTAEILARMALTDGAETPFHWVVMDEFHFYSDPQRGMAWLVPLVEMTNARFLLMSATLADPKAIATTLESRTATEAVVVKSDERPVPLEFEYRDCLLLETIEHARLEALTPTYLVSFTKRDAAGLASQLRSTPAPDSLKDTIKANRKRIEEAIKHHRFDTPFGKSLRAVLPHGIAVHHGGMLPKHRRLVEKLAADGLISLICGTDTLGVGVNMPIRSVIFTQLYKFDGKGSRLLAPREFAQIAGRAGRKGHDDVGTVMVQAPEHEVRNARKKAKVSGKKARTESPPRGFKGWNEQTLEKMRHAKMAPLVTRFEVTGLLVLQILDRHGDGRAALKRLIETVGEDVEANLARADEIIASFEAAGVVERLSAPDEYGCLDRVSDALDTTFDRPLAPFLTSAVEMLDQSDPEYPLNLMSLVEAITDDPNQIIRAQVRKARNALYAELRAADPQSMDDRNAMQDELDAVEHPQPLGEEVHAAFSAWRERLPFLADEEPKPKSIARDLYECGDSFREYVQRYDLNHDEGSLLRHLSDVYRLMSKSLPEGAYTDEVDDLIEWLSTVVHQVDSSVVSEWERFGQDDDDHAVRMEESDATDTTIDVTRHARGFRVMVRNEAFTWIKALAARSPEWIRTSLLSPAEMSEAMAPYWERFDTIDTGPAARGPGYFSYDPETGAVEQQIVDPHGELQWVVRGVVDVETSRDEGCAIVRVEAIGERTELR